MVHSGSTTRQCEGSGMAAGVAIIWEMTPGLGGQMVIYSQARHHVLGLRLYWRCICSITHVLPFDKRYHDIGLCMAPVLSTTPATEARLPANWTGHGVEIASHRACQTTTRAPYPKAKQYRTALARLLLHDDKQVCPSFRWPLDLDDSCARSFHGCATLEC
ncbi:hypothetical protein F5148DRAFT_1176009 [Russula earlei]|uniref:Uncharacterized protein n=1 Tax=Russula earlei TaxID=71964 RepID=A0ACC0UH37_9AGAM|nr:hypothetical protein F5148DRAFT_1176009 [Russula earlei]